MKRRSTTLLQASLLRATLLLGCITAFGITVRCSVNEPVLDSGSICIVFSSRDEAAGTEKACEILVSVHCTLKRGSILYYDQDLIKVGNVFEGRIDGLPPADDYALALYGKKTQGADNIVAVANRTGIVVHIASQTEVILEWSSFLTHLSSPVNGAVVDFSFPAFCWSRVQMASFYRLKIDDDAHFLSPVQAMDGIADTQAVLWYPLKNGLYYWKVSGADSSGNSGPWSDTWTFTVSTPVPDPPEPVSPQDGATVEGSRPVFVWNAAPCAFAYSLQVSSENDFRDPVIHVTSIEGLEYRNAPPLSNGSYFWRVASTDTLFNTGEWTAGIRFFVAVPCPDAPRLLSPGNGSLVTDSVLVLAWEAVPGALEYRLQVDTAGADTAGLWKFPLLDRDGLHSADFAYTPRENARYFWRVAAKDEAGNIAWSDGWLFIKSTEPVLPKRKQAP